MRDIGLLSGGTMSVATAINDSGQVAGYADELAPLGSNTGPLQVAVVWQGGVLTALPTFVNGYDTSRAFGISNSGRVVGAAALSPSLAHAALFGLGTHPTIDLGALASNNSQANAMNSAGQVVGTGLMLDGTSRAFVWDATNGLRDLNAVLPIGPTWTLTSAIGINASGQVVGAAQIDASTGLDHTFIGLPTVSSGSPPSPNPAPALTVLSPASSAAGGGAFTLTVSGSGFVSGSQVQWKELPRTTTFVSSTQLTTTLQAADVASAGAVEVAVVSPAPGGGISTPQVFFIVASGAVVTGSNSATSANPQGSARASTGGSGVGTSGSLTATAGGNGTVTVAQYTADPISQPGPNGASNYFDLHVSSNSDFNGLVLVDCNLTGLSGTTGYGILYWWSGGAWQQAGPQKYDPATNCTTLTISVFNASPGLLQLAGTAFAVVVDRTPPTTTITATTADGQAYVPGTWTNQTVLVSLAASDDLSGIKATYDATDAPTCSAAATGTCTAYTAPFAISAEGTHSVVYFSIDNGGNTESARALTVKIDKSPPTTNLTPAPGTLLAGRPLIALTGTALVKDGTGTALGSLPFTCFDTPGLKIGLTAADSTGSGPASLTYAAVGAQPIASTTTNGATAEANITASGLTTFTYSAIDQAGNQEAIKSETIVIGAGFACAGPRATFSMPMHGTLQVSGTATTSGNAYPFSQTVRF